MTDFAIDSLVYVGFFTVLCAAFLRYYFRVSAPYKNFPSYRLEHQLVYWIIARKPLNSFLFQHLLNIFKRHETDGICAIWFGKPYLFIFSEDATKLLIDNPAATDKPYVYKQFEFCLKNALFTCNGEKWRRLRMFISPAFQVSVLRNNVAVYNEYSARLVQRLSTAGADEAIDCLKECSMHASMESIYGFKADNPENELMFNRMVKIIGKLGDFAIQRLASPWLFCDFTLRIFPSGRESLKLYDEVFTRTKKILEDKKESLGSRMKGDISSEVDIQCKPMSVAEVLLDHHIKDPSFSLVDVLYQINSLITTNSEGVSNAMMWCLFLLGHHQDVQEKAFEEVITETGDDVAFEELRNLKYLECVIKETLRLYPTIPVFGRHLSKEMECGNYTIPKDSSIIFFPYMLHRNPDIYPDPEKFDPDRFIEGNSKINAWNYIPFAEGIRSCPGKNFAVITMKVILCHIIRNFRIISLDRREDVGVSWGIVLSSSKKLRMKFVPRMPLSDSNSA